MASRERYTPASSKASCPSFQGIVYRPVIVTHGRLVEHHNIVGFDIGVKDTALVKLVDDRYQLDGKEEDG